MHATSRIALSALAVWLLTRFSAFAAPVQPHLPEPVRAALRRAELPASAIGVVVLPLAGGKPLWAHGAYVPMQPASTIKLVTSAVALERLTPDHRGFTELRSAAQQQGDVLQGDLVLRGGADPELGLPQLWALLAELRWLGVRELAGDIILDRNLFRPARSDTGVPPFDESPAFQYNVIPDALNVAGSLVTLELVADANTVQARLLPPLENTELVNSLTLVDGVCRDWDESGKWTTPLTTQQDKNVRIELRGNFARHCSKRAELQLMDRNGLAERLLHHAWASLGGTWAGQVREGSAPEGTRLLARRESRPWGEVLRHMNKTSDNPETRLLFLSLGVPGMAAEPGATTAELAARDVKRWFAEHRINAESLVLDNGSGLSRSERITPMQLARVIQEGLRGPYAPELLMSMPLAGVDTTRFKNTPAEGRARLKPGGLRNVGSLAGVVQDASGKSWVMVAIVNHEQPQRGREAINALVEWIARSGAATSARPGKAAK